MPGYGTELLTLPATLAAGAAGGLAFLMGAPQWGMWTIAAIVEVILLGGIYYLEKPDISEPDG